MFGLCPSHLATTWAGSFSTRSHSKLARRFWNSRGKGFQSHTTDNAPIHSPATIRRKPRRQAARYRDPRAVHRHVGVPPWRSLKRPTTFRTAGVFDTRSKATAAATVIIHRQVAESVLRRRRLRHALQGIERGPQSLDPTLVPAMNLKTLPATTGSLPS